jgi:hypothetical protein
MLIKQMESEMVTQLNQGVTLISLDNTKGAKHEILIKIELKLHL